MGGLLKLGYNTIESQCSFCQGNEIDSPFSESNNPRRDCLPFPSLEVTLSQRMANTSLSGQHILLRKCSTEGETEGSGRRCMKPRETPPCKSSMEGTQKIYYHACSESETYETVAHKAKWLNTTNSLNKTI